MTTENKINGSKCANVKSNVNQNIIGIKGNLYNVNSFFSLQSSETVTKKIERLIRHEVLKKY